MAQRNVPASTVTGLLGSWMLSGGPAYKALADGLRLLIADGRIPPGVRLPSERDLTEALGVSRTTVTSAYAELRDRGYLTSRRGSGSVASVPVFGVGPDLGVHHAPGVDSAGLYDFTCAASPAVCGIGSAVAAAADELPIHLATPGYHPQGIAALREAIADRYAERGLPTSPDQIVVTAGALAATSVVVRAMTSIGDRVLTESPTHPNSIDTIRRSGTRIVAAPMSPRGWDLPLLEATIRQTSPRAAWMVLDFQNPTGHLMPAGDRERLAAALARARTTAIVDESLVELSLDVDEADMPAPFASFQPHDVISIGGVSKSFWGGLRIGWLRAPELLVPRILDARASMDLGAPVLEQLVVTRLLRDRVAILADRRADLAVRRSALVAAVTEHLPDWRFDVPPGGLSLWCELPAPVGAALVGLAERHGVLLMAGSRFSPDRGLDRFVRLPYTSEPQDLTEGVRRIALAYDQLRGMSSPRKGAMIA
jgi:DNA-binding transcriptional MocR family regulator